jgi:L-ribulose-5-phosphate 4-epimerase
MDVRKQIEEAVYYAKLLFDRNKVTGSSANLSFKIDNRIYITASGTSFGNLQADDFSVLDMDGNILDGKKPSKEFPLHRDFYLANEEVGAIIHTHSTYATLWSIYAGAKAIEKLPRYTPYLRMKVGEVINVPYAAPGTEDLFKLFRERLTPDGRAYLLENHGPVVGSKDIKNAFYAIEELEESCLIAWALRQENLPQLP